ncbi:hypothetical protein HAX54_001681, partial [Datura stramonium]|nr:hypothetical protein [Datura stramonium]
HPPRYFLSSPGLRLHSWVMKMLNSSTVQVYHGRIFNRLGRKAKIMTTFYETKSKSLEEERVKEKDPPSNRGEGEKICPIILILDKSLEKLTNEFFGPNDTHSISRLRDYFTKWKPEAGSFFGYGFHGPHVRPSSVRCKDE